MNITGFTYCGFIQVPLMDRTIYFNGKFVPENQVRISFEDRGFQFGDGVYEVIKVENGRAFALYRHLRRLARSLHGLDIRISEDIDFGTVVRHLIQANSASDGLIYIQITRGAAPRAHGFPKDSKPTVVAYSMPWNDITPKEFDAGASAIIIPDERWGRCDIKSLNLLANVLAKQKAAQAEAAEALLERVGVGVLEGTSSNLFAVSGGNLVTAPSSPYILGGITREIILELADQLQLPIEEKALSKKQLLRSDEAFITNRGIAVLPLVTIDDNIIGSGKPGPITRRLAFAYNELISKATDLEWL
ncbi:MAG: D-amino-acid transaminase [Firmicutes bacterium]|nr:D-amino-acid transaminase [Bacillota bacterium]